MSIQQDYERFKKLYEKAIREGRSRFKFQGQPVLTTFAKYYLQYLEGVLSYGHTNSTNV